MSKLSPAGEAARRDGRKRERERLHILTVAVVHVVEAVALHVVLPARVARARRQQQVHAVPEEGEGRAEEDEAWQHASVVEEVLDRVHAEAREGLDVRVAMVQRVHEAVEHATMPVCMRVCACVCVCLRVRVCVCACACVCV